MLHVNWAFRGSRKVHPTEISVRRLNLQAKTAAGAWKVCRLCARMEDPSAAVAFPATPQEKRRVGPPSPTHCQGSVHGFGVAFFMGA
jgi:hypothetical protein